MTKSCIGSARMLLLGVPLFQRRLGLGLAVYLIPAALLAQEWGRVYFANDVLSQPPDRMIVFVDGTLLVGTNFVAQLYYGTNRSDLVPVTNPPVRFPDHGSPLGGRWVGGFRTLTGIAPGTTVALQVFVWDSDSGATPHQAAANRGFAGGSVIFEYAVPMPGSPTNAHYMENFLGMYMGCPPPSLPIAILESPTNQTVAAGSSVRFRCVATNACYLLWQFNGTNLAAPGHGTLVINNVGPEHAGHYRAITGRGRGTSAVAVLTVVIPPQLGSLSRAGSEFRFYVPGDGGRSFAVEATTNLTTSTAWLPLLTNTAPFWFTNSAANADRQRFYRAVLK